MGVSLIYRYLSLSVWGRFDRWGCPMRNWEWYLSAILVTRFLNTPFSHDHLKFNGWVRNIQYYKTHRIKIEQ